MLEYMLLLLYIIIIIFLSPYHQIVEEIVIFLHFAHNKLFLNIYIMLMYAWLCTAIKKLLWIMLWTWIVVGRNDEIQVYIY